MKEICGGGREGAGERALTAVALAEYPHSLINYIHSLTSPPPSPLTAGGGLGRGTSASTCSSSSSASSRPAPDQRAELTRELRAELAGELPEGRVEGASPGVELMGELPPPTAVRVFSHSPLADGQLAGRLVSRRDISSMNSTGRIAASPRPASLRVARAMCDAASVSTSVGSTRGGISFMSSPGPATPCTCA